MVASRQDCCCEVRWRQGHKVEQLPPVILRTENFRQLCVPFAGVACMRGCSRTFMVEIIITEDPITHFHAQIRRRDVVFTTVLISRFSDAAQCTVARVIEVPNQRTRQARSSRNLKWVLRIARGFPLRVGAAIWSEALLALAAQARALKRVCYGVSFLDLSNNSDCAGSTRQSWDFANSFYDPARKGKIFRLGSKDDCRREWVRRRDTLASLRKTRNENRPVFSGRARKPKNSVGSGPSYNCLDDKFPRREARRNRVMA